MKMKRKKLSKWVFWSGVCSGPAERMRTKSDYSYESRVINVTENFRIDNDDLCYIMQQRFTTKKGDVGWRNVTYHSTIANALETIAERETKRKLSSINIDIAELAKELETARKEFLLEVDKHD